MAKLIPNPIAYAYMHASCAIKAEYLHTWGETCMLNMKPPPAIHTYYHSLMNALLASMPVSSNASGARWMPDHAGQQPAHYIPVLHAAFFHSAH